MSINEVLSIKKEKKTNPISRTVAEAILEQLTVWGIRHVYGLAGDAILPFLDQIHKQEKIRFYAVRHESAAGFMASAEGKCAQRLAVCTATSGPGLVNMLNGIADAAADRIPMLVITGQVERENVGTEAKQYVDQQQMIAPLAVYSSSLLHPEATIDVLQKAIIEALTKKGPAHISVPRDIFEEICTVQVRPPLGMLWNEQREDLHQLDRVILLLSLAKQPLILIGEGARNVGKEVISLAESLQAGVIESLGAKGIIPYEHPLLLGGIGEGGSEESKEVLQAADLVLIVGANWWPDGFVPQTAKVIQIDLSAASIEAHMDTTCGIVGDAAAILPRLTDKMKQQKKTMVAKEWYERLVHAKASLVKKHDQVRSISSTPIAPQRLMAAIDQSVAADAIMVVDTGDHTLWFNRLFRAQQQELIYSGKWRTMGFGLPAAIAAKLTHPKKQVVAIVGDGCLAMSMMELSTAVKYKVAITIIVLNNKSLGMEKHKMEQAGLSPFATRLTNPNFAEMAKTFGAGGIRIEEEQELNPALEQALRSEIPVLIDVLTDNTMPPVIANS